MLTQAPRGTADMLPQDAYKWEETEKSVRSVAHLAGYREIRTPMFEHTELFARGVGDTTDVVQKEMYTFSDRSDRSITLKPEGTAGAVRAFIESHMYAEPLPAKLFYVSCPCFRYEKPQAGRLRQFHQNGIEVFGAGDPSCDAEVISIGKQMLEANRIRYSALLINSIGCKKCRAEYNEKLRRYLEPKLPLLCADCRDRFDRNPLRILDCKVDSDKLQDAPSMLDSLCGDCRTHFEKLRGYLGAMGIGYRIDPTIVRGLDYYTKTVFEFIVETPSGKLTVCGGGRYDGLVEELGGPSMPGIGFGMGVERMLMVREMQGTLPEPPERIGVFIATMGDEARLRSACILQELRAKGISCDMDHVGRSMKAQFKYADKLGASRVLVIGPDELAQGMARLRDMRGSGETLVPLAGIADSI